MKGKQKLGGNLGYVEGEINGLKLDDGLVSSVAEDLNASKIFEAKYVNSANEIKLSKTDGAWLRTGDSEFQMITQKIAQRFNLEQGKVYTQYTGTVKIVSELPYCASCSGVIHQVSEMLPNVKFIIVNGAK
jgi:ribosomal protein S26